MCSSDLHLFLSPAGVLRQLGGELFFLNRRWMLVTLIEGALPIRLQFRNVENRLVSGLRG